MQAIINIIDVAGWLIGCLFLGDSYNKVLTPKYNKWLLLFIFAGGTTALNIFFNKMPFAEAFFGSFQTCQMVKSVFVTALWIVHPLVFYKDSPFYKIRAFIVMQVSIAVAEASIGVATSFVFDLSAEELASGDLKTRVIMFFIIVIAQFVAALAVRIICKRRNAKVSFKVYLPVLVNVILCVAMFSITINSVSNESSVVVRGLLLVIPIMLVIVTAILYKVIRSVGEKEILKEKLYWMNNIKNMEMEYYNHIDEQNKGFRRIRHDYKDNIETVSVLLSSGGAENIEKAKEILEGVSKKIDATSTVMYSQNKVVNAVVTVKSEEAKSKGVDFEACINIPNELGGIESIDINSVFANVLQNAIEGCERVPETEQRFIELKADYKAGFVIIKCRNSCYGINKDENGKILTSKEDKANHGFGLVLLEDASRKYEGEFTVRVTGNVFETTVALKLN